MRALVYILPLLTLKESSGLLLPIKSLNHNTIHPNAIRQSTIQTHSTRTSISLEVYSTESNDNEEITFRSKMRKVTGFSLTASRAAIHATTGVSLTALRTTLRTLTGISVTGTMKWILGLFPMWVCSTYDSLLFYGLFGSFYFSCRLGISYNHF